MARIYRKHPDSSNIDAPRVFVRVFCSPGELRKTVDFYKTLTGAELDMDQDIPEASLHVVAVGPLGAARVSFSLPGFNCTEQSRSGQLERT